MTNPPNKRQALNRSLKRALETHAPGLRDKSLAEASIDEAISLAAQDAGSYNDAVDSVTRRLQALRTELARAETALIASKRGIDHDQ